MRILILSFYYYPDLCAGSFRCTAFVDELRKLVGDKVEIDVMTTVPNRYASFNVEASVLEEQPGLRIERIPLPSHASGMLDQAKAFVHFGMEVHKRIKKRDYALVFATSSRLMTAALGASVARRKKAKLYLDIRDLFVDTIQNILPKKMSVFLKPMLSSIEKWSVNQAQCVNLVSKGFESYFSQRYPAMKLSWFTNGIDEDFILSKDIENQNSVSSVSPLKVVYAGNIGEGQGLHAIIPALAKRMEDRVHFKIIGDGGKKTQLVAALREAQCCNVELIFPLNRSALIAEYQQADILFLHLNDYDAFLKVLPSKLFEYAAMGKPIWAGIAGYSAEFLESEISNAVVFPPCNVMKAEEVLSNLKIKQINRASFIEKYDRSRIMRMMAEDMLLLI